MDADIAILGSGIAATLTLIELFGRMLNSEARAPRLSITVIEKNKEFWKGIPYGSRSSINALTITSVHDFIYEPERLLFFEWLKRNKNDWASYYSEHGGLTAERWLSRNLPLIEAGDWEAVYIPRFVYGRYLHQKLHALLEKVQQKQLAEINIIQAEAIDIKDRDENFYEVTLEHPDKTISKITSHKVVIATGSAPVRKMCNLSTDKAIYVNDIYEPSVNENIKTIQASLTSTAVPGNRNILVIGSNASSLELVYLIEGMPEMRALVNKIVIISTSGLLPYHISTEALKAHPIPNLDKLKATGNYTIEMLTDAAAKDIMLAVHDGANMDYVATIISTILKLMEALGEDARKQFFAIHALRLRDMFRRAGPEYRGIAQSLLDLEEVILLKGKFIDTAPSADGAVINYLEAGAGNRQTYPLSFRTIINCSGSDDLNKSASRLLYNIVNNNVCNMNLSGKGIEVNEKFEAAPNLYVIGPLLGGNVNRLIHFWQLENASRLTYLAPYLAKELLNN